MENIFQLLLNYLFNFFNSFFSLIDNTVISNLDNILFISPNIAENLKFQNLFGTKSSGILLIANSLIIGIFLFYILNHVLSHLIYIKSDSPQVFIFKALIFIACMNSSLWICQKIIWLFSILSELILEIGNSVSGSTINFNTLLLKINNSLGNIDSFSINWFIKLIVTLEFICIILVYSFRYIECELLMLLSPFAILSLIHNKFDNFFKIWIKKFISLLFTQIIASLILTLGIYLDFSNNTLISNISYVAILLLIIKPYFSKGGHL